MQNNKISTKIWGPHTWYFLHVLSFTYPLKKYEINRNKKYYINFYNTIGYLLPCVNCSRHYKLLLEKNPVSEINSRYDLVIWTLNIHNMINLSIGKRNYSYKELKKLYLLNNKIKINHQILFRIITLFINNVKNVPLFVQNACVFIKSLIYIFPCKICQINLGLLTSETIINRIKNKNKLLIEFNSIIINWTKGHLNYSFILNKRIQLTNIPNNYNKVYVAKSDKNVGLLRMYYIRKNTSYKFSVNGYKKSESLVRLWIGNIQKKEIEQENVNNKLDKSDTVITYEFNSKNNTIIYIGLIFVNGEKNDEFYFKNMKLESNF